MTNWIKAVFNVLWGKPAFPESGGSVDGELSIGSMDNGHGERIHYIGTTDERNSPYPSPYDGTFVWCGRVFNALLYEFHHDGGDIPPFDFHGEWVPDCLHVRRIPVSELERRNAWDANDWRIMKESNQSSIDHAMECRRRRAAGLPESPLDEDDWDEDDDDEWGEDLLDVYGNPIKRDRYSGEYD